MKWIEAKANQQNCIGDCMQATYKSSHHPRKTIYGDAILAHFRNTLSTRVKVLQVVALKF